MLRHRPPGEDPEGEFLVRDLIHDSPGRMTLGAIAAAAESRGVGEDRTFSALMRMALAGTIKFDQSQPLSPSAAILLEG